MIQGTSAIDRPLAPRSRARRVLPWAVPAVVVVGLIVPVAPAARRWLASERSIDLERVRIGQVARGDLERDVSVEGKVVAAFHPTAFSPASGVVTFAVKSGDMVAKGQVLARVASPEIANLLEQESSSLQSLQTESERQRIRVDQARLASQQRLDLAALALTAARRAMDRADRSREAGILNAIDYEKAQDDLRRAELEDAHAKENAALERSTLEFELRARALQVERQRLVVAEARRKVLELTILAPLAGRVGGVAAGDRDAVAPGQPLATVVDLSHFEVEVAIPEAYADEIAPGTPAEIRHGARTFAAEVRSVSPQVESNQVSGQVTFRGEAPQGLRQNQRLPTRLILESRRDVLKVPRGPFLEAGGGGRVWVVEGDVAVLRKVRVGATSVGEVQILEGLNEGEHVVISDTTRFENAERVFLRR